jgi:heat shock protein HslJ
MRTFARLVPVALLAACSTGGGSPASPSISAQQLDGTAWRLVVFEGHRLPSGPDARPITLRFAAGRVSGHGPCNALGGDFSLEAGVLRFGPLATSKRLCPGERSDLEGPYLEALRRVARAWVEGDTLVLEGPDARLRLARDSAPENVDEQQH